MSSEEEAGRATAAWEQKRRNAAAVRAEAQQAIDSGAREFATIANRERYRMKSYDTDTHDPVRKGWDVRFDGGAEFLPEFIVILPDGTWRNLVPKKRKVTFTQKYLPSGRARNTSAWGMGEKSVLPGNAETAEKVRTSLLQALRMLQAENRN